MHTLELEESSTQTLTLKKPDTTAWQQNYSCDTLQAQLLHHRDNSTLVPLYSDRPPQIAAVAPVRHATLSPSWAYVPYVLD